jgi:hypothetical protein
MSAWSIRWLAVVVAASMLGGNRVARADLLDLALQRLVTRDTTTGTPQLTLHESAYRQLVSELGVVLSPKFLTTADTVGYSGYQFTFDASFTSISSQACAVDAPVEQCPWTAGASGVDGQGTKRPLPGYASTLTVMARKGIWLPLPSFEIGAGATRLLQSDLYAVQLYAKFALHEGFHDWPIPSLAVRGSVSRMLGSNQLDLTAGQIDVEISKSFGLFGTVTLVPYGGFAALFIVARGQVLDTTPDVDAYRLGANASDLNNNVVFPDQDTILRWRFFAGFRLNYSILVLSADYSVAACGDFSGSPSEECSHKNKKIADNASTQHTFSISAGFLF